MNQEIGQVSLVEVEIEKFFIYKNQIKINKNPSTLREGLSYRFSQTFMQPD
jgi:hypothetical protein